MEIIMTILIVLVCIIAGLLILALFIPKHYTVAVSGTIQKPRQEVLDYVSMLQHQLHYSEWLKNDPELVSGIRGVDGTAGAILHWKSNNKDRAKNTGAGEQEIKRMDSGQIDVELRLLKPQAATCRITHQFIEEAVDKTRYTCTFFAYARFPVNLPAYIIGRRFIRKAQQKTLRNIRIILEQADNQVIPSQDK